MFSGSPESGHTLVVGFVESSEVTFSWICLLLKNCQSELISGAVDIDDQSWIVMAAFSPSQFAWVNCQTRRCWGCSLRMARERLTLTSTWSDESIGAEDEQDALAGKLVITQSRREDFRLGDIQVGKFTDWVSLTESQKSFAEVSWLMREVTTPSQFAWWQ